MLQLIESKAFVEVKAVHGNTFYGTSIEAIDKVLQSGKRPVSEVDVQGALELTKAVPHLRPVFVLPPNYDIWMERLGARGFMSYGEKQRRLHSAKMELEIAINNSEFLFVINNEVEQTAAEIKLGVDSTSSSQVERRQLAKELLEYVSQT